MNFLSYLTVSYNRNFFLKYDREYTSYIITKSNNENEKFIILLIPRSKNRFQLLYT